MPNAAGLQHPYAGEWIVPESDFLRTLPRAVDRKGRICFESIVQSADIMTVNFRTLVGVACEAAADNHSFDPERRAHAFGSAWSIVDQLYACRQIIPQLGSADQPMGPLTLEFMRSSKPAVKLRNHVRHIASNLGKLTAQKMREPIFGHLSYFHCGPNWPVSVHMVIVGMGYSHSGEQAVQVSMPQRALRPPADHFVLSAFGTTLEIGAPLAALRDWIAATSKAAESDVASAIATMAFDEGLNISELQSSGPTGMVAVFELGQRPREGGRSSGA